MIDRIAVWLNFTHASPEDFEFYMRLLADKEKADAENVDLRHLRDELFERLKNAEAERDGYKLALFDLCDGSDMYDIEYYTGLSQDRCKEIIALSRKEGKP
jgi:hypothetical protein